MNNNLIKKETGFIKRIKDWIKSKFKKTFENGKKVMEITEENEQQSNITIPPDTQLEIDDNSALIPDLPSYFPLEHIDKDWEKKIEKAKKVLYKKLAKYGITKDEWEEIDKYKGSAYFCRQQCCIKLIYINIICLDMDSEIARQIFLNQKQ